jgi:hypothetical protein
VLYALLHFLSSDSTFTHLAIAVIYFILYTGLTLLRKDTRDTLLSIWDSITSKKKNTAKNDLHEGEDG